MDYSNTHFYRIVCNDLNVKETYIGHTLNCVKRPYEHKNSCLNEKNKNHNLPIYKIIRENGNWGNWSMVLIDTVCCETRLDVLKKEREYIEKYDDTLNQQVPSRTKKEWYDENKESIYERSRLHYQNIKNII